MPYNIKRVRATFLKKKYLIWGFCTKMDNRQKMRFSSFMLILSEFLHDVTIAQKQA